MTSVRTKFQVVALLVREERARIKADTTSSEAHRAEQLKRLDGIATILAQTAAADPSLFALLADKGTHAVRHRFAEMQARRQHADRGVEAAREYVEAMLGLQVWAHGVYGAMDRGPHGEGEAHGHG